MTGVLLYQPNPRWRIGAALSAAALIHLAAITFASIHPRERIDEIPSTPGITELVLDPTPPIDDPAPPSDPVAPTPSQDTTDKLFADANSTPPPIRHDSKRIAPIAYPRNPTSGSLSLSSAKVLALNAPKLEYPYEAKRQKITGSGTVVLTVDPVGGNVTGVVMETSTGSSVLDNAALTGFRRWRFKPGTALRIRAPITYTLTGAGY